jgi:biotin carboxylase
MKRLLLVAATTGYQTRAFAEAAARAGMDLALATDRCHILDDPWGDRAIALRFEDPPSAAAAIEAAGPFDGIAAVGDHPAYIAALAAERLGLPFHPSAAVAAASDKFLARGLFQSAGLLVPAFFRVALDDRPAEAAARAPYPCVLKPLGLSASRGVIRADSPAEFLSAFDRIRALLDSPALARARRPQDAFLQVEAFIPGAEFALEGLLTGGRLRTLALFDKPDPLDGPFFEETIYVTPSRQPAAVQRAIGETVQRAVAALGLGHGPIHAEVRVNPLGVWMLEVAPRPIGGLCAKALPGLEELILRHAVGLEPGSIRLPAPASAVMMIPIPRAGVYAGFEGAEEALGTPGIVEVAVTAKPGQHLLPLPEGHSYLGFLFAAAGSPGEAEAALRRAHACLEFDIQTALPVL